MNWYFPCASQSPQLFLTNYSVFPSSGLAAVRTIFLIISPCSLTRADFSQFRNVTFLAPCKRHLLHAGHPLPFLPVPCLFIHVPRRPDAFSFSLCLTFSQRRSLSPRLFMPRARIMQLRPFFFLMGEVFRLGATSLGSFSPVSARRGDLFPCQLLLFPPPPLECSFSLPKFFFPPTFPRPGL